MTNLAPGVTNAHPHFHPEDDPPDVLFCEDPECGYHVDAFEHYYDEDPCCPECGCPLQPEQPEGFTIAFHNPLTGRILKADAEPIYGSRRAAERALDAGRDCRFEDHPDILLIYRVVSTRELDRPGPIKPS